MLAMLVWMTAHAASPGHYHAPEIAASSKLYAKSAESASSTFSDRQAQLDSVAAALSDYRVALDLLGDRAPATERERLASLEKRFNRERAVVGAFASTMMDDFDGQFSAAMARATPASAVACQPQIPQGPSLPGMPVRTKTNPDCKGSNLSSSIGKAMDNDAVLGAAVAEILAIEWPVITVAEEPQSPAGHGSTWVSVATFFGKAAGPALARINKQDEAARLDFQAALEQDVDKSELKAMVAKARQITQATADKRSAVAAPALDAVDAWSAKRVKKGGEAVSWCANPSLFGACTGTDGTRDPGKALLIDKKIAKSLP